MSELSTVAIKDGHRGHLHGGHPPTFDAERADRISRLAGLERVATARQQQQTNQATSAYGGQQTPTHQPQAQVAPHGYFDATGNPAIGRERSTVGSASATGSVGARTTWAGSEAGDVDKMSESQDMDMDTSSVGGMSEQDTGSLVGFGEGARTPARQSVISSPGGMKGSTPTGRDAKMIDGVTYDRGVVDTTTGEGLRRTGSGGAEEAERIMRENMDTTSADRMRGGPAPGDLGKFGFEK